MWRRSSLTSLFALLAMASPAVAQEQLAPLEGDPAKIAVADPVSVVTTPGTAGPTDYDATPAPVSTDGFVSVETVEDVDVEPDETFTVTIVSADPDQSKSVEVTIRNDDEPPPAPPGLSITGASVLEADGTAVLTVTASEAVADDTRAEYVVSPGTATAGDFDGRPGVATIRKGERTAKIAVPIVRDDEDENDEAFTVRLVAPNTGEATVIIRNDDLRSLAVGDALIAESDGENAVVRVPITLDAPTFRTVTARFATLDGTAGAPEDFLARLGTVTIPPGQTSATVEIPVVSDDRPEGDEEFAVRLSRAQEATVFRNAGNVVVRDDDAGDVEAAAAADLLAPALKLGKPRIRGLRIRVRVSCPTGERFCTGRMTLSTTADRRSKAKSLRKARRLAQRTYTISGGEARTLTVRFSERFLAAARRSGRLRLRAHTSTTDAAGNRSTARSAATLRVKRRP